MNQGTTIKDTMLSWGFCPVFPFEGYSKNRFSNHLFNYIIANSLKLMHIHLLFGNNTSYNVSQRWVWREWCASAKLFLDLF